MLEFIVIVFVLELLGHILFVLIKLTSVLDLNTYNNNYNYLDKKQNKNKISSLYASVVC